MKKSLVLALVLVAALLLPCSEALAVTGKVDVTATLKYDGGAGDWAIDSASGTMDITGWGKESGTMVAPSSPATFGISFAAASDWNFVVTPGIVDFVLVGSGDKLDWNLFTMNDMLGTNPEAGLTWTLSITSPEEVIPGEITINSGTFTVTVKYLGANNATPANGDCIEVKWNIIGDFTVHGGDDGGGGCNVSFGLFALLAVPFLFRKRG